MAQRDVAVTACLSHIPGKRAVRSIMSTTFLQNKFMEEISITYLMDTGYIVPHQYWLRNVKLSNTREKFTNRN